MNPLKAAAEAGKLEELASSWLGPGRGLRGCIANPPSLLPPPRVGDAAGAQAGDGEHSAWAAPHG